jgi:DNA-binding transcriptional MerR regulator
MNKQYQMKEVARLLGVKSYRISYALTNGHVQEPKHRIANTRVFSMADVEALAEHFNVPAHTGTERIRNE